MVSGLLQPRLAQWRQRLHPLLVRLRLASAPAPLPVLVERLVAKHLGSPVRHVHSEAVAAQKSARRSMKRRYARHILVTEEANSRRIEIFTKTGGDAADARRERFVSRLRLPVFSMPAFVGSGQAAEGATALWVFATGGRPSLAEFKLGGLMDMARAIAVLNGHVDQAAREIPDLPVATRRAEPEAPRMRAVLQQRDGAVAGRLTELDRFARLEEAALERLGRIGNQVLVHQDIGSPNLLLDRQTASLFLLDWEKLAVAAPGCDLRWFAAAPPGDQRVLADCYVETLAASGHRTTVTDVLFAMNLMRVLRERDRVMHGLFRTRFSPQQVMEKLAALSRVLEDLP